MITKNPSILSQIETQFLPPTLVQWINSLSEKTKNGDEIYTSLHSETEDGIVVKPIYFPDSNNDKKRNEIPFLQQNKWKTLTTMPSNFQDWQKFLKTATSTSMNALFLPLEDTVYSTSFENDTLEFIESLVKDCIETKKTIITSPLYSTRISEKIIEQLKNSSQKHCFLFDPFHKATFDQRLSRTTNSHCSPFVEWNKQCSDIDVFTTGVNTSLISLGGATSAQEIGYAIASMVEYLRYADNNDIDVETILNKLVFTLTIDTNFFEQVAKLRAIRLVWNSVLSYLGIDSTKRCMELHTVSSMATLTKKDPYTNLLRIGLQSMVGVIGNASAILIPHFDITHSIEPSAFSLQIAQQMHHIFSFESGINDVIDPSKGAYYIEELTAQIAEKGLAYFKQIEKQGGMLTSLSKGLFQQDVNDAKLKKMNEFRTNERKIVGTSYSPIDTEFPQDSYWKENLKTKKQPKAFNSVEEFTSIVSFDLQRYSESFE